MDLRSLTQGVGTYEMEFDRLVEAGGTMIVAKNDFDRLLGEGNYREIFRRQYELAPSISGDAARAKAEPVKAAPNRAAMRTVLAAAVGDI